MPPVYWNGGLYVAMAVTGFWMVMLSTDEAGKYMSLQTIFWSKVFIGTFDAIFLSIKLFMSNNYSDHQAEVKRQSGNTEIFVKKD